MNILAVLVASSLIAAVLAHHLRRWDTGLAWILAGLVVATAGLRLGGFDHDEYLDIIDNVRALADEELPIRVIAAKDPVFFVFIEATGRVSDDPRLVFVLVAAVGMACKVLASAALPRRRTLAIALYTVFLAPGLEFAAIRTGMAVGMAMLALSLLSRSRHVWMLIAVASHVSLAIVAIGRLLYNHRRLAPLILLAAAPVAVPWMLATGEDDPRFTHYLENPGNLAALTLPALTLLAWWPVQSLGRRYGPAHPLLKPEALACTWFSLVIAVVMALPSVTVSFRTLETGWVLILVQTIALMTLRMPVSARPQATAGLGLLLLVLTLSNFLRSTWSMLLDLPY